MVRKRNNDLTPKMVRKRTQNEEYLTNWHQNGAGKKQRFMDDITDFIPNIQNNLHK